LPAIKAVLSNFFDRDLLIVLGDFNLPDISWSPSTDSLVSTPLSVRDFVNCLLELLLQQVSFIRYSLNKQVKSSKAAPTRKKIATSRRSGLGHQESPNLNSGS